MRAVPIFGHGPFVSVHTHFLRSQSFRARRRIPSALLVPYVLECGEFLQPRGDGGQGLDPSPLQRKMQRRGQDHTVGGRDLWRHSRFRRLGRNGRRRCVKAVGPLHRPPQTGLWLHPLRLSRQAGDRLRLDVPKKPIRARKIPSLPPVRFRRKHPAHKGHPARRRKDGRGIAPGGPGQPSSFQDRPVLRERKENGHVPAGRSGRFPQGGRHPAYRGRRRFQRSSRHGPFLEEGRQ